MVVARILACPCPIAHKLSVLELPFISIIVPAHNAENTIGYCLTALQEQLTPTKAVEIIVIDDASTDHSIQIAETFPVQIIALQQNIGAARARNYAADLAKGKYLFFLDADVILLRNSFTKLIEVLDDENPDALVGSYTVLTKSPGFFSNFQNFYTYFNHDQPSGRIYWFWTALGVIKRDVFIEMGGFSTRYRGASAEDMDLGYRLADAGKLTLLEPQVRGEHRHHHTFGSILRNDFRKSAAWGELYLRTKRSSEYKHSFTGWVNQATLFGVWMILGFALLSVFWLPLLWAIISMFILLLLLNGRFYIFILSKKGLFFLLEAIFFHLFTYFPIGLGSMKAIWRFLTGKDF